MYIGSSTTAYSPCDYRRRPGTLFVVLVIIIVVVIMRFGTRALGGPRAAARTGFHGHDERPRLYLRSGVEYHDGFPGRTQQALFFQYLEYASRHLARAAHQSRKLLPA